MGGPAPEPPHRLVEPVQPAIELGQQARLAVTGVADDGDHLPLALLGHVAEAVLQLAELGVPPDGSRVDTSTPRALSRRKPRGRSLSTR